MTREEVLDEINVLYERISNPEDCENGCYSFSDGNYTEALEILIDYYEVGVIEELEKIKAEIMSIGNWREHYEMPIAYLSCLTIVEHHISELKGEQE